MSRDTWTIGRVELLKQAEEQRLKHVVAEMSRSTPPIDTGGSCWSWRGAGRGDQSTVARQLLSEWDISLRRTVERRRPDRLPYILERSAGQAELGLGAGLRRPWRCSRPTSQSSAAWAGVRTPSSWPCSIRRVRGCRAEPGGGVRPQSWRSRARSEARRPTEGDLGWSVQMSNQTYGVMSPGNHLVIHDVQELHRVRGHLAAAGSL